MWPHEWKTTKTWKIRSRLSTTHRIVLINYWTGKLRDISLLKYRDLSQALFINIKEIIIHAEEIITTLILLLLF